MSDPVEFHPDLSGVWLCAGGMAVDVYDSMAEGVQNSYAVVCFMNEAYAASQNCK